nr:LytTR family DNA-binding domain-containing protein [Pseudoalteromonas sp. OANN1]
MIWHKFIRIESKEENNSTAINQRLLVDLGGDKSFLQIKDIVHIVAAKNYVEIHTESHQYLKRATLSQFEAMLPSDMFVRTHRSYLVNLAYVERITTKASGNAIIKLSTGTQISLSKGYKKVLKSRFDTLSLAA